MQNFTHINLYFTLFKLKNKKQTGTFFSVTTTAVSSPLIAMEVIPTDLTALNAYSIVIYY